MKKWSRKRINDDQIYLTVAYLRCGCVTWAPWLPEATCPHSDAEVAYTQSVVVTRAQLADLNNGPNGALVSRAAYRPLCRPVAAARRFVCLALCLRRRDCGQAGPGVPPLAAPPR